MPTLANKTYQTLRHSYGGHNANSEVVGAGTENATTNIDVKDVTEMECDRKGL